MAEAQPGPEPRLVTVVDAPPEAELIFLPTNEAGAAGQLNTAILTRLGLPVEIPRGTLERGYALSRSPFGLICFVVTVGHGPTEELLNRNFARALRDSDVALARSYWVPLMGTGEGGLPYEDSFRILFEQLSRFEPIATRKSRAVIALPPGMPDTARDRISAVAEEIAARVRGAVSPASATSAHIATEPGLGADSVPSPAAAPYSLPRSGAVDALLQLASTFAFIPAPPGAVVSTSLLFFALAESQTPVSVEQLHRDVAARYFAMTVEDVCGERYEAVWLEYFGRPDRPSGLTNSLLPPTANVGRVLREAHALAGGGTALIEVGHLITALLRRKEARLRQLLEAMQVSAEEVLAEYGDARLGRVATKFQNDVANSEDHLDYDRYASAIHDFLTHEDTHAPLSISIQAPWGGGKSTLMHLLREALDPDPVRNRYKRMPLDAFEALPRLLLRNIADVFERGEAIEIKPDETETLAGRRWTIWFNAWKYETTEQLWAGLVDAIVSQVSQRLSPYEREKFLLKLQLARIDDGIIRKRIYDRVANFWWRKAKGRLLLAGSGLLTLFGLSAARSTLDPGLQQVIALWTGNGYLGAIVVQLILTFGFLVSFWLSRAKTRSEPAKFSLADILRVPDYDKGVGELHHVHADLRRVLEVVPHRDAKGEPSPLVIFIDDLDRCSPGKVASVVEGVSMLLATDEYRCMFVIGMDPQMVAAALEKAHEAVREKLPSYEQAVPLGWRFMDKFVQLPFTLPPSEPDAFKRYVEWLAGAPPGASVVPPPRSVERAVPAADPASGGVGAQEAGPGSTAPQLAAVPAPAPAVPALDEFTESRNVGAIIRRIAGYSVGNPREMKRMVNLARFYLALRIARARTDPNWQAPDPHQYARWIALTLRWPDMMRWLQWGADETRWPSEEATTALVVRRLRVLEAQAELAETSAQWREALKKKLALPTDSLSNWSCDAKLFEFFKAEHVLVPGERLSDAALAGFW